MTDLFDLFDDPPPEPAKPPAPAPEPAAQAPSGAAGYNAATPCRLAAGDAPYRCRVGGGGATFTDDGGRTHFCGLHANWGFFPHQQGITGGQPR